MTRDASGSTFPDLDELERLARAALQFLDWAAGEGICPTEEGVPSPDVPLFEFASKTGNEDYASYPDVISGVFARLREAERSRDEAVAERIARAKSMLAIRNALINIRDAVEDEGDRAYFGSTNDADDFKEAVDDLDKWNWHDIMRDGERDCVFEASRKAHARAEAAEAALAEAVGVLKRLTFAARTSGGTAGRDEHLCGACDAAEAVIAKHGGSDG